MAKLESENSTTTNGMHDLHLITLMEHMPGIFTAWHDLAIDLHGQASATQLQLIYQLLGGAAFWQFANFAIEFDFHGHEAYPATWGRSMP